jgi:hypothetical protein
LLAKSQLLQSLLGWSLFNVGDVNACRDVLSQLRSTRDASQDRVLAVNLAITSGDWLSLASFVEQEWERRSERSAAELLRAGQIAQQLGSTRAKALILEAAARASDNPHVLVGSYSAAMGAGWEDAETFKWLERAAALSDEAGPVQRVSIEDILDRHPDWQRRETQAWEQLGAGLIPIIVSAKMLNRSLIELSLLPALANLDTIDPRRRLLIHSYSGSREVQREIPRSLAIDPTAVLTAGLLGILDKIVEKVHTLVLPHTTLGWLFEETQRVRLHQPSRVAHAHELKRLVTSNVLQQVITTAPVDEALEQEVGAELASLFAEAEADWGGDRRPRLVVRSKPIHRIGSLMKQEAELGSHASFVCGCLDVVQALAEHGRLTQAEETRARAFLSLHETPWSGQIRIELGSVLYLDGVSLGHLQHLHLLGNFEASGFTVMVPTAELTTADRHIEHEALVDRTSAIIERIRETLRDGIARGKVVLAPKATSGKDDGDEAVAQHPALEIIRIAHLADAMVIDDRYFNQNAAITHESVSTPVLTTADLLAGMGLTIEEHAEQITQLRRAGRAFLAITSSELDMFLNRAAVMQGRLIENAELKAIRENLQICRMSTGLQLPKEAQWLDRVVGALIETIKSQWKESIDVSVARARSTWLLQQLDIRGWAHRFVNVSIPGATELRFRGQLWALLTFRLDAPSTIRRAYWEWLDEALVDAVREHQRETYDALVDDVRQLIANAVARRHAGDADVN